MSQTEQQKQGQDEAQGGASIERSGLHAHRAPSFTPAPWVYRQTEHGASVDAAFYSIRHHWTGIGNAERIQANSRLIAAAPDLYSMVADLKAWMQFALADKIRNRPGTMPPTYTDGYSYVEIPEWDMRQKLDAILEVLATTQPAGTASGLSTTAGNESSLQPETEREAAINALPDEVIARTKAELEEFQWFHDLPTNEAEDRAIFDRALEMQEKERLGAIVAQTTKLDTLKSVEQVREEME